MVNSSVGMLFWSDGELGVDVVFGCGCVGDVGEISGKCIPLPPLLIDRSSFNMRLLVFFTILVSIFV